MNRPIGIVVVGHGPLATALVEAALLIIPEARGLCAVAIDSLAPVDTSRTAIEKAIRTVDQGGGVLLLTDMFGGTPSNLCLSFLQPSKVEVISGVNLPMLIKLVGEAPLQSFHDTVSFIQKYGQKNIVIASDVLKGKLE